MRRTATALVVNPNTNRAVTQRLVGQLAQVLGQGGGARAPVIELRAATARFGAAYIASEAGFAIAAHAVLDSFARALQDGPLDAVVVGCFGDPGIQALRELTSVPVIGLAEAAVAEAARHGRFAIVTGGVAWRPMLRRIVAGLPQADRLDDVRVIAESGGALADDRERALRLLAAACRKAARPGVDAVILGGAGFAGYGDALAAQIGVPVIDSVSAAGRALRKALSGSRAARRPVPVPTPVRYRGLAAALRRELD
ncbi:MAG: aspartate/glutamate racemase family protein [Burkholderiaceae bacterium]